MGLYGHLRAQFFSQACKTAQKFCEPVHAHSAGIFCPVSFIVESSLYYEENLYYKEGHVKDPHLGSVLEQIQEIHGRMAHGQLYHGYRPLPVALSGSLGLLGAWLQPRFVGVDDARGFLLYWMVVAIISAGVAISAAAWHFARQPRYERRQTLHVLGQFLPCLVGGAVIGAGVVSVAPHCTGLLPGLWAVCFSLGIFSSRPFLPRATGWVALYYMGAGAWLLLHPQALHQPAWALAITFFLGQCAGAVILYLKLERSFDHVEEDEI